MVIVVRLLDSPCLTRPWICCSGFQHFPAVYATSRLVFVCCPFCPCFCSPSISSFAGRCVVVVMVVIVAAVHVPFGCTYHGTAGSCLPSNVAPSGAWSPRASNLFHTARQRSAGRLGSNPGDGEAEPPTWTPEHLLPIVCCVSLSVHVFGE